MDDTEPKLPRSTPAERLARLLNAGDATDRDPASILFAHTVMCQTGLPYRNPGDDVREWERVNGAVHMSVAAGKALHPDLGRFVHTWLALRPQAPPFADPFERTGDAAAFTSNRG